MVAVAVAVAVGIAHMPDPPRSDYLYRIQDHCGQTQKFNDITSLNSRTPRSRPPEPKSRGPGDQRPCPNQATDSGTATHHGLRERGNAHIPGSAAGTEGKDFRNRAIERRSHNAYAFFSGRESVQSAVLFHGVFKRVARYDRTIAQPVPERWYHR
ncbi:hypothetical protein BS50DRAFT_31800 [Corynespora cassiicola Philippines]|uniref:Uncharacterized protein n=1 Tax=Corynespora cassiicola Philippines TaxID=1448308 RepID=A0A2T2PBL6_CORCC|nr:hypothetical protein BS50DRAFT_31800 [Corynespora cassiicola Philippines]